MTTNFLKMALSVLVTGIAATAAVNTQQSTTAESFAPNERGFIQHSTVTDCTLSDMCNPSGSQACTVGNVPQGAILWKKNANSQCVVPLYKPQ
jgi:hypothetical protein